jgi:RNA polymerase sigma-70 factor (ECF subfamily)
MVRVCTNEAEREAPVPRNDRDQFEWLLVREVPHLRRYAHALLGSAAAADDLVQDTLERALRKWKLWRPDGALRSWLFRLMYRQMLNSKRSPRPDAHAVSLSDMTVPPSVSDSQISSAQLDETVRAVARLPAAQREALLLVAVEGMGYEEAAWVLGIPIGTLRSRIARGRDALRELDVAAVESEADVVSTVALRRVK